ncbi:MAG TPA: hypothetical protein VMB19_00445 [Silvibacterium sp.]|nr:hypothetical protein [Silvibacterium sp.]
MLARSFAVVLLLGSAACFAQETTSPELHHRTPGAADPASPGVPSGKQRGTSTLPDSASGEYMLDETGSVVQITVDNGVLDGYISKVVEGQTTALTYFFDRTTIDGNHLTFTTRHVHGIWYSFDGDIVRGDVPTKQENGFYRLKGAWVMHADAGQTQSTSRVSFKSTPRSQ